MPWSGMRYSDVERALDEWSTLGFNLGGSVRDVVFAVGGFVAAALDKLAREVDAATEGMKGGGKFTYYWAQHADGEWWLVAFGQGEPMSAWHPKLGEMPAHRDTFVRWGSKPVNVRWSR